MIIRKYLFWKCEDGIRTYKVTKEGMFELMKPSGKDVFTSQNWDEFATWFNKSAAITDDECIDFCFLSNERIDSPLFEIDFETTSKSSWDKKEIRAFCKECIKYESFEVFYSENEKFVCQSGNLFDENSLKTLYLKCVPEFSAETEERIDTGNEETSLVNRYFIEKLNEIMNR